MVQIAAPYLEAFPQSKPMRNVLFLGVSGNPLSNGSHLGLLQIALRIRANITAYPWKHGCKRFINNMEHNIEDFSRLSLKEIAEIRIVLLDKVQEQIRSAISTLNSQRDLSSVKKDLQFILQRVYKNVDLIKTSCKEEGTVLNLEISHCNFVINIS